MLDILRKKGVYKRIIWVIVVIIIISFGLLGTAYLVTNRGKHEQYAGKIFGKKISPYDYDRVYQDVMIQAIIRYGQKFNEIRQYLNLDAETWDRLILLNEAEKRNIKISDAEVIKTIEEYPFFQRDGQFDSLLYKDILKYVFHIEPRKFEENIRQTLRLNKLIEQEAAQINLSEEDVTKAYQEANEKVQVSYIFISPDKFKNETVSTEAEEKQYYESHKNDFQIPESINVEYIAFPLPADTDPSKDKDTSDAKEAVRNKAQTIYEQLKTSSDLSSAAKENNLEIKSSGFFSFDQPNLSLGWSLEALRNLFSTATGTINPPFETSSSIVIAKIADRKESSIPELSQVQAKVKDAVILQKAKSIAKEKAQNLLNQVKEVIKQSSFVEFPQITKNLGADIEQTPIFTRGQYLPKIGIEPNFQDAAFQLNDQNKLSDVVETQNGWAILYLDQKVQADMKDFDKQKQEFANKLLSEKKMKFFSDYLTGLRLKANLVDNISKMKEENQ